MRKDLLFFCFRAKK